MSKWKHVHGSLIQQNQWKMDWRFFFGCLPFSHRVAWSMTKQYRWPIRMDEWKAKRNNTKENEFEERARSVGSIAIVEQWVVVVHITVADADLLQVAVSDARARRWLVARRNVLGRWAAQQLLIGGIRSGSERVMFVNEKPLLFPSKFLQNRANISRASNTYNNAKYSSRSCVVIFKMPRLFALYSQMTTVAINETRYGGRE